MIIVVAGVFRDGRSVIVSAADKARPEEGGLSPATIDDPVFPLICLQILIR